MREVPLNQLADVLNGDISQKVRKLKINLFSMVIRESRVDTGRLRGNWQTTPEEPAEGELERLDQTGSEAIAEVVAKVRADGVDYLTNNLSYAEPREEKDGMVAKSVARLERHVQEAIK